LLEASLSSIAASLDAVADSNYYYHYLEGVGNTGSVITEAETVNQPTLLKPGLRPYASTVRPQIN
jgi:hypothetical protein